jgi:peptidase E
VDDIREWVLDQDAIYVSGGSVANLTALWRLHGVDEALAEAWRAGVVLSGQSAGALCWHVGGNTDSFGPTLQPWAEGLAFLPYSCGVHYDSEPQRRPLLQASIASGELPDGFAADEGVALHYVGTEFIQAVSINPEAAAYRIERQGAGVKEFRIEPRLLTP